MVFSGARNVIGMQMKKIISAGTVVCVTLVMVAIVPFQLSKTRDAYVCHSCKGFGRSTALRVFRFRVIRTHIRLTRSLTGQKCSHTWEWYFANSHGLFFNSRGDWDGPIGAYPYHKELDQQLTENKQVDTSRH